MAINYSAGFLPQALYSNMMQTQREGLAEANRRERERYNQLGQLGAAFVKGNINMGDKAQEAFTKDYETKRQRLTDTMGKLDPRSGDYENYKNAIANLDSEYTNTMQAFQESGFLGSLGRDRDMLSNLTNYEPGSYSPDSTAAAYALTDDQTKYQNKRAIDLEINPQIEAAKKTAGLTAAAEFSQSELGQAVQNASDDRALALEKEKLALAVQADIQKRGGTYRDVAIELEKIRNAKSPEELALKRDEMALRRELMNTEYTNRTALENLSFENDKERYRLQNEYTTGQIDARGKNSKSESLTPKQALELRGKIQEEVMMELGIPDMAFLAEDPDKKAEYDALFRKKNNEIASLYPGYKFGDQTSQQAPIPKPEDFGVGAPAKRQPRLGEGFISPEIVEGYQGQLDSLLENADRLTGSDGKPVFKDLQKKIDSLQVEAESLNKQIRSAKTMEEKNEAIGKLNSIVPRIYQLNTELFQRAEQRRKGQRTLGMQLNAVPGSAMNYTPPGA